MDDTSNDVAYFQFLAAVAAADGVIRPEERSKLEALLQAAGADPGGVDPLLEAALLPQAELPSLSRAAWPGPLARGLLRDGLLVAFSDGEYTDDEREVIVSAAQDLGQEDALPEVTAWVQGLDNLARQSAQLFGEAAIESKP